MIEKYTISFSVEADVEDKKELAAFVWTLLKLGKQACGEAPVAVPDPKEIKVGLCDETYQPLRLFLMPSNDAYITEDMVPACTAKCLIDLYGTISDYIAHSKIIAVVYVPKGTKQSEGRYVYSYSDRSGAYKDYAFFRHNPELA